MLIKLFFIFTFVICFTGFLYGSFLVLFNFASIYLLNSNYNQRIGKWFYTQPSNPLKWNVDEKVKLSKYGRSFLKGIFLLCTNGLILFFLDKLILK